MDVLLWVGVTLAIAALVRFVYLVSKADGDIILMSKGPVPPQAFEDRVVWITGASQGIGEALAKDFARLGAKLIISSRRQEELERVKRGLVGKHAPDGVVILPFDMTAEAAALQGATEKAEAAFDRAGVDYMVHNAAHPRPRSAAMDVPEEVLQATFNINVLGIIRLTNLLLPGMLRRKQGHFVVVSSVAGRIPAPGQSVYAASKHAVHGYFDSLRSEIGNQGIKFTLVCPGPIDVGSYPADKSFKSQEEGRLGVSRCSELIVRATLHGLDEAWISRQPILLLLYVFQYFPALGSFVMRKVGPKRVAAAKAGKDIYSTSLLFK